MNSNQITFIRKPSKHGRLKHKHGTTEDLFVFTIPQKYIRSNLIDPLKKYKIILEPFFDERNLIQKMMDKLDENFIFGKIDKETYYNLNEKYRIKLEQL